jgi:hypothetical protein
MVPPTVKVPQFMELRGMVHALSEYTPKFADVDTAPVEDTVVDVLRAANVVSVKAIPIMTNATTAVVIESFRFAVVIPCSIACILSLNKHYRVLEQHRYTSTQIHIHQFNPKTQKQQYSC